ncbi:MAG: DegV family protein [Anaerolineae bacterium]
MVNTHKIVVVTDSSAYIPETALVGLDVAVIPLWLFWDKDRLRDGVDIDPPAFYNRLKQSKSLPTSSQPSPAEFVNFFLHVAPAGEAIVAVLASSKISGTVASARAAQEQLPTMNIRVVDSLSSSMGLGLEVLAAARVAAAGGSIDEAALAAEAMREKVHFLFVVDTLEYLQRGGRIGKAKQLLGTALNIKPILQFREGVIESVSQERTKRKALTRMMEIVEERLAGQQMAEAAIVDVAAEEEGNEIADMLVRRFGTPVIHRSPVSPVVGTHVGPGAIGLAFYSEP